MVGGEERSEYIDAGKAKWRVSTVRVKAKSHLKFALASSSLEDSAPLDRHFDVQSVDLYANSPTSANR
jgi:hypothetical protein